MYGCPVCELGAAEALGRQLTNSGLIRPPSANHDGQDERTVRPGVRPRATAARRTVGALLLRQTVSVFISSAAEYSGVQVVLVHLTSCGVDW